MTRNRSKANTIRQFVEDLDFYAMPVTMSIRGKDKFRTLLGGVISLILILFIISVFGYKLNDMINRNLTQIKKNTLVSVSNSYLPPLDLSAKNITVAF